MHEGPYRFCRAAEPGATLAWLATAHATSAPTSSFFCGAATKPSQLPYAPGLEQADGMATRAAISSRTAVKSATFRSFVLLRPRLDGQSSRWVLMDTQT